MSTFSTRRREIGFEESPSGFLPSGRALDVADDLYPPPNYHGPVIEGKVSANDRATFQAGHEVPSNTKYSILAENNTIVKERLSSVANSLGVNFNDDRIKEDLINATIIGSHMLADPLKEDAAVYEDIRSQIRGSHADTMNNIDKLFEAVSGRETLVPFATNLSVARVTYLLEHFELKLDDVSSALRYDLDPRRIEAVQSLFDDYDLVTKCDEMLASRSEAIDTAGDTA